jgi:integrase
MEFFKKHKTISDILPDFLMEKEAEDSGKVYDAYIRHINSFTRWLEEHGHKDIPLRKITPEMVRDYFFFLGKERELDKTSCERYFLSNRALFKYAVKIGETTIIPFNLVVFPRKKKDQGAEMIPQSYLKPLLLKIKAEDPQLYLACMIEYYCFIRPGRELRLLRIGDIDLDRGLITVRQENAKNKTKQIVTMPLHLIEICKEYGIDTADKNLYVFGNKKKFGTKPFSVNMLRYRFNQFREEMGLPKEYKLYSMKHTGASNLHLSGISMRELMDQLRHTKLEATQHYLKKHCGIVNDRIRDHFPCPI